MYAIRESHTWYEAIGWKEQRHMPIGEKVNSLQIHSMYLSQNWYIQKLKKSAVGAHILELPTLQHVSD